MSDADTGSDRYAQGVEAFHRVYPGTVPLPPAGFLDFVDLMMTQLFAEQWRRPELGMRDRRLITLGAVLALGESDAWCIHVESALRNGELTPTEAREILIHLAQYVGYPRTQGIVRLTEEVIARLTSEPGGASNP